VIPFRPGNLLASRLSPTNLNAQTLLVLTIQVFGLFRDFGGPARIGRKREPIDLRLIASLEFRALLKLEGNPATDRTTACAELGKYLSVVDVRLEVEQVARVNHSFSTKWQTKTRQFLGDLDA
jgi:hypothetical protein